MKFSRSYASVEEITDDETAHPIGTQDHVHSAVAKHFPGTNWNDVAWGIFESPVGSAIRAWHLLPFVPGTNGTVAI